MLAVVTGGSRGIGYGITKRLLDNGYYVVVTSRQKNENIENLEKTYGEKIDFLTCDISSNENRKELYSYIKSKYKNIDLLVNNAGVAPRKRKDMLEITEDDFDYVLNINLKGTYFLTQELSKLMIENKAGRIINISSISADTVSINRAEYCISKAGISMITKLYAIKLAEYNIGVFEIRPGIIETDMTKKVKDKYVNLINQGLTPIKRMGQADDIAKCVISIAKGNFDFCTGTIINADGGFSLRRL